ncbi:MAG: adenine deaminase [ANME-2 cluster archaeon]|nr:adenine deaminase [ANME-2 cluster archaeon]MBC2701258.1 adenine deaminase [ANME-2 cluster archaeon]MBC2708647.1 adenine deaminase [ANME-2 cluster archaeon]MBC2748641.1 adenine deaminase [ANME-2 cluster archaeon]MBC2762299.1 adenine deaminase [ANME-2 cluster archaeon]
MQLTERIFAGKGDIKADTVLEHCRIINVNTKEILNADIAIQSGYIVGIGDVSGLRDASTRIIDVNHRYVSPGLLDGHVHFESTMVTLSRFARKALEHGTTGVVIDPHEIANVLGRQGIELVMEEAKSLPLNIFVAVSSCVPATPFETSGASLDDVDVQALIDNEMVVGLGEVMDFPAILNGDAGKLAMIQAARKRRLVVDGHAPGLSGPDLWGYMAAGISSDHESLTYEEALEKLRLGMKLMLREGSAAKSLDYFLPRLLKEGVSLENVFFVTDDKHPEDLLAGYMDAIVRKAIALGLDPLDAISMCTINTARHYRIDHLVGSISIGRRADLVILDNLEGFSIHSVIAGGTTIAPIETQTPVLNYPDHVLDTIRYREIKPQDLKIINTPGSSVSVNVIKVFPDQIFTEKDNAELVTDGSGILLPDLYRDILSTAVIERHGKNGNIGLGFVSGFDLKSGAFAQSIGHDSHNVVVTGTNHADMALAANAIKEMKGGIVLVQDGEVLDSLSLPFAGLLSPDPVEEVALELDGLHGTIKEMGCTLPAPFITHSFIALPVIPKLRLTDMGLFDVERFEMIEVIIGTKK